MTPDVVWEGAALGAYDSAGRPGVRRALRRRCSATTTPAERSADSGPAGAPVGPRAARLRSTDARVASLASTRASPAPCTRCSSAASSARSGTGCSAPVRAHLPPQRPGHRPRRRRARSSATNAVVSVVAGPRLGDARRPSRRSVRARDSRSSSSRSAMPAFALVHDPWNGFLVAVVTGVGNGFFWPAQSTLITQLSPLEQRHTTFAMQRVDDEPRDRARRARGRADRDDVAHPRTFVVLFLRRRARPSSSTSASC